MTLKTLGSVFRQAGDVTGLRASSPVSKSSIPEDDGYAVTHSYLYKPLLALFSTASVLSLSHFLCSQRGKGPFIGLSGQSHARSKTRFHRVEHDARSEGL